MSSFLPQHFPAAADDVFTGDAAHIILESEAPGVLTEILNKSDKQDRVPAAQCIAAILSARLATLDVCDANQSAPTFTKICINNAGISNLVEMLKDEDSRSAAADAIAAFAEYGIVGSNRQTVTLAHQFEDPDQRALILKKPGVIKTLVKIIEKLSDTLLQGNQVLQGDQFVSVATSLAKLAAKGKYIIS